MNESFWIMQGYEIYIWPSYVLTLLSLGLLFVHSTKQSQKAKKLLKFLILLSHFFLPYKEIFLYSDKLL